jgi:hypothetical protein
MIGNIVIDVAKFIPHNTFYDVSLYLDERGVPGTEPLFITGGILVYGDTKNTALAWSNFSKLNGLERKGKGFNSEDFLQTLDFLFQHPILPVAIWSELSDVELKESRKIADKYHKSEHPRKRADKISPAIWIWTRQILMTIAHTEVSFLGQIGQIKSAHVYLDEFIHQPELQSYYKELIEQQLSTRDRFKEAVLRFGGTTKEANQIVQAIPEFWRVDLNPKGPIHVPLLHLADVVCAMFGRYHSGECREPWDIIRIRYANDESEIPVCIGRDATWTIRDYLLEPIKMSMEVLPKQLNTES